MNFLLDNPIASMDGTAFLVLFIVFIVLTLAVLAVARATIDSTDRMQIPAIPPQVDPFEVAYLRGGANELARSVVFSLVQKGFLEIANDEKSGRVRRQHDAGDTARLPEIEQIGLAWIGLDKEAKDVFDPASGLVQRMEQHSARYQIELANRQFLMPDEWSRRAKKYGIVAALAIAGLGGYKVLAAVMVGRFNIIFTIVLTVIAFAIAMSVGRMPRVTKLGKQYLERLQTAFEDLKYRSQAPYIGAAAQRPAMAEAGNAGIDPLLLPWVFSGPGFLPVRRFQITTMLSPDSRMLHQAAAADLPAAAVVDQVAATEAEAVAADAEDAANLMGALPNLGVGLGFRPQFKTEVFLNRSAIDFLEITSDHYIDSPPKKLEELELLAEHFPLIPHSLELSLGSAEGVDENYLSKLADIVSIANPAWFSDHICFTRSGGVKIGHLAPVPFTEEALGVFVRNIERVEKRIDVPLILENITYNIDYPWNEMSEATFIRRLLDETDCGLLLDVANLYINSANRGVDWQDVLAELPLERLVQLHFVGAHRHADRLIDAHADATDDEIWNVFHEVAVRCNIKGVILERDENFPEFSSLISELQTARDILNAEAYVLS